MPFLNEHSARITDPGQYTSWARQNIAPGIDIVLGIKGGVSERQSIRFKKDKFTVAQAKAWLKEHNIKYTLFEPAKASLRKEDDYAVDAEMLKGKYDIKLFQKETFSIDKDILSVGTWQSMQGEVTFTKEDLQEIADNLDALIAEDPEFKNGIPLKINLFKNTNPENTRHGGQPSFGWIKQLKVKGEKLFAKITNIPKLIKEMIENKQYREVSAEVGFNRLVGNERLRKFLKGVALLGVELPAVENLDEFEQFYSLNNTEEDETSMSLTVETNNKNKKKEGEPMPDDTKELEAKNKKLEEENAKLKKDNEDAKAKEVESKKKETEAEEKLSKSITAKRTEEIKTFVKEKIKEGKILPANEESNVTVLESLSDEQTINFSKDGKDIKISPREMRQIEIEGSPNVVEFSEKLKKEKAAEQGKDLTEELKTFKKDDDTTEKESDQKAHHIVTERIAKFQKENVGKDVEAPEYEVIYNQVLKDYPELG